MTIFVGFFLSVSCSCLVSFSPPAPGWKKSQSFTLIQIFNAQEIQEKRWYSEDCRIFLFLSWLVRCAVVVTSPLQTCGCSEALFPVELVGVWSDSLQLQITGFNCNSDCCGQLRNECDLKRSEADYTVWLVAHWRKSSLITDMRNTDGITSRPTLPPKTT